jgi:uncharacterized membrane protein YjfL (UPF0719 family)
MTEGLTAAINLLLALGLCWLGSRLYGLLCGHRELDRELTLRDNAAFAVPFGGFLLGIMLLLASPWTSAAALPTGQAYGFRVLWGALGIGLLAAGSWLHERFLFQAFDPWTHVFKDRKLSAGIVLAGSHVAAALITRGALADQGGPLAALVFWLYAEVLLLAAMRVFLQFSHYHLASEFKRDNRAAALAVAGAMIALGNLLGYSITGAFLGWSEAFAATTTYALAALVFLYLIHRLTDWLFFPHVTLHQEIITQDTPNTGVGYLVAVFYIGLSCLIGWSL